MIPKINPRGHSFKGVITYLMHDKGKAKTAERVAWYATGNMLTSDPMKAAKVMAWTDKNADYLKLKSGVSNAGRPTEAGAVYHYALSWAKGENPDKEHQLEQVLATLKCQKLEGHEYVIVAHNDTDHIHVHIVVNLTHPETGKRHCVPFAKRALQKWALGYEREHGIHCHARVANAKIYEATGKSTKYRDQKQDYSRAVTRAFQLSDDGKSFVQALKLEGLHLAPGKHDKKFVIVDQRTGDIQALTRNLDPVDKYQIPITGRAKGDLIRERLKDLERSDLPDADQLSKQIRAGLQRARGTDPKGNFKQAVDQKEKSVADRSLQEAFENIHEDTRGNPAQQKENTKEKEAQAMSKDHIYAYDRDAQETARQIALIDAAHEATGEAVRNETVRKKTDKEAGRAVADRVPEHAWDLRNLQEIDIRQQLQERPDTQYPSAPERFVPSFASTYRDNDDELLKESRLKQRIAEKREYWRIPKLERQKRQADQYLKEHSSWFYRHVRRGIYARAREDAQAEGKNLDHARWRFKTDIKALCEKAKVDKDFTNGQLEKYGFKPEPVVQKQVAGPVIDVKQSVNDNQKEAGELKAAFSKGYGQEEHVFKLDINSEAGRALWAEHKGREQGRGREKEGLER